MEHVGRRLMSLKQANANYVSSPETPTLLNSSISNKSTSVGETFSPRIGDSGTKHRSHQCASWTLPQSCIRTSLPSSIILSNAPFFTQTHCFVSVCEWIWSNSSAPLKKFGRGEHSSVNPRRGICLPYWTKAQVQSFAAEVLFPTGATSLALTDSLL